MTTIYATGARPADSPAINISGGSGNTDRPEIHIAMVDEEFNDFVQGWFPLDEIERAIAKARRVSVPAQRITEPGLITDKTFQVIEA